MKKIIWKLTPIWLGHFIYKVTGYLMAARFDDKGDMINFYFQKESPSNWPKK